MKWLGSSAPILRWMEGEPLGNWSVNNFHLFNHVIVYFFCAVLSRCTRRTVFSFSTIHNTIHITNKYTVLLPWITKCQHEVK